MISPCAEGEQLQVPRCKHLRGLKEELRELKINNLYTISANFSHMTSLFVDYREIQTQLITFIIEGKLLSNSNRIDTEKKIT